jgi:starvation-inducible DNA-binding protein
MAKTAVKSRQSARLHTRSRLPQKAVDEIGPALAALLADTFALYLKTKNFHWHMSGTHFRDYHLMLDEHADQLFAMTDPLAERARKLGANTLHSIGEIARLQRVLDNDADYVSPADMLAELRDDNRDFAGRMAQVHELCDGHGDVATTSLLEVWIDEAERRSWFLFEAGRATNEG